MSVITREIPEGHHSIELTLVDMLAEKHSWLDMLRIHSALSNVRRRAKQLREEHNHLNSDNAQVKEKI
jgi:hypothetical protein